MAKNAVKILLAIAALLLFSGCISQEMSVLERQQCIELSSRAFAKIPGCSSQQECFSLVQQEFFGYDEAVFSPAVREELHSFKNHLAISWLYFNQAGENVEAIRKSCSSKQETSSLPFQVNELNHALRLAFSHSDSAFEKAFAIILLEENDLQLEELELVSEEPLFDSYIELNNNLNDIDAGQTSETFAGHYIRNTKYLQQLVQKTGFSKTIIEEKNIFDLLDGKVGTLAEEGQKRSSLKIPFLSPVLDSFVAYLNSTLKIRQVAYVMPEFPSFEFFQTYDGFCGTESSSAERFAVLMQNNSERRQLLIARNNELEKQLELELSSIEQGIEELYPKSKTALDQNLLSNIYSLLGKESGITVQRFGIQSLYGFKEKATAELAELKAGISAIKRESFLEQISLGRKTSSLKELLAKANNLNENLEYLSTEILEGALLLCEERIAQIKGEVSETNALSVNAASITDLKSRVKFKISKFEEAKANEKMFFCKDILVEYNSLQTALQDFYLFKAEQLSSFESCIERLEPMLSNTPSELGLSDLKARFESIKSVTLTEEDLQAMQRACSNIETDLKLRLQQSPEFTDLAGQYSKCKILFSAIMLLEKRFPKSVSQTVIEGFSKKFGLMEKYFDSGQVNPETALPVISELGSQFETLEEELNQLLWQASGFALEKTFLITLFPQSIPVLGKVSIARARLVLENPVSFKLQGIHSISLPSAVAFNGTISMPNNISSIESREGKLHLVLNGMPEGFTVIDFNSEIETSFLEKTELLSADQFQAIFKKQISITSSGTIPKLKADISLLNSGLQIQNVNVYRSGKPLEFSKEGHVVSFYLENAEPTEEITIFFSAEKPISVNVEVAERQGISDSKDRFLLNVAILNKLPVSLEKLQIRLPLGIEGNDIIVKEFIDESGKKLQFELLSGSNITLWPNTLAPGQEGLYRITLEAGGGLAYWSDRLESQKFRASSLAASKSSGVSLQAKNIFERFESFGPMFFESKDLLTEFASIIQKLDLLEAEEDQFFNIGQQFDSVKESILEGIAEMEKESNILQELDFPEEAAAEKNRAQQLLEELSKANALKEKGELEKALEAAFVIHSTLPAQTSQGAKQVLESKKQVLLEEFTVLAEAAKSTGLVMPSYEKEILLAGTAFDSAISSNNLGLAKEAVEEMGGKISEFSKGLDSNAKIRAEEIARRVKGITELSILTLASKLASLSLLLESVSGTELRDAKYLAPITSSRLGKIALEIESLNSPIMGSKFNDFLELQNQGKNFEALTLANTFSKELEFLEQKAVALELELDNAIRRIEEDALASFNSAAYLFNSRGASPSAIKTLEESETLLKQGDFLKSIALSRNAVSLVSLAEPAQIPIYLYPAAAAIILIVAVRFTRKKKEEETSKKLETVTSAWED